MTLPASYSMVNGFSRGIKRPRREVYNSLSSKAEVKNRWCYTSTPPAHFHGAEKENLTYYGIIPRSPLFLLPLYDIMGWRGTTLPLHARNRGMQSFQHANVTPKHSFYISIRMSVQFLSQLLALAGLDSSVSIAPCYGPYGPGIESQLGRDFPHSSRPALVPTQFPIRVFPESKAAGAWLCPPTPSSATVKERVQL